MATQSKYSTYIDSYGPSGQVIAHGNFTGAGTGQPTVNEAQGFTVARTGTGVYVLTFARAWRAIDVTLGFQSNTAAQIPIITAISQANRTVTITVVGAGGATPADATTSQTVHVQAILRTTV